MKQSKFISPSYISVKSHMHIVSNKHAHCTSDSCRSHFILTPLCFVRLCEHLKHRMLCDASNAHKACRFMLYHEFQLHRWAPEELLCLLAPLASCLSSSSTCCRQLTNCHGTLPDSPAADVSAGWLLMKTGSKTSSGLSSGGPGFITPVLSPEATGSILSARTDPSEFKGLAAQRAEASSFRRLVLLRLL